MSLLAAFTRLGHPMPPPEPGDLGALLEPVYDCVPLGQEEAWQRRERQIASPRWPDPIVFGPEGSDQLQVSVITERHRARRERAAT